MKKLLGIILICLSFSLNVYAFEDYILLSEKPVKKIVSSNQDVIVANVLVTIMNEKNTVIVQAKGKGKAVLIITVEDKVFEIPVEVRKDKTVFKKHENFEFIQIDTPPESLDIDLPPEFGGKS